MFFYFRKFIQNFSIIEKPLYDPTRKDVIFRFTKKELEAKLEVLKKTLIEAPILTIYDPHAGTELHCDASSHGYGAILLQKGKV